MLFSFSFDCFWRDCKSLHLMSSMSSAHVNCFNKGFQIQCCWFVSLSLSVTLSMSRSLFVCLFVSLKCLSLSNSPLSGQGLDVKNLTCLSIALVNREFDLIWSLFLTWSPNVCHIKNSIHSEMLSLPRWSLMLQDLWLDLQFLVCKIAYRYPDLECGSK